MYKNASRFRQSLARQGKKLTSRNIVASDSAPAKGKPSTRLQRLDRVVGQRLLIAKARYLESDRAPRLVKSPKPRDGSN